MKAIIPLIFLCVTYGVGQNNLSVTFQVDMQELGINLKDTTLEVGLRGSLPPLFWVQDIKMKDDDRDGIYTATVSFEELGDLYFKYVLNEVEWESGDAHLLQINERNEIRNDTFRYVKRPGNPFQKFIGEWTLKDDNWEQSNGDEIESIKIPNHYTICQEVNTDNSLLWEIDASSAKGHILWVYDYEKKEILHSSSFYPFRNGTGKGSFDENGNISLKISFAGEPEGTYRLYNYHWLSEDAYELKSTQYNAQNEKTGNYYGGTFVRINKNVSDKTEVINNIKQILAVIDDNQQSVETELDLWEDQLEHLAPDNDVITSKTELKKYLQLQESYGRVEMKHDIVEVNLYEDIVLMRGEVKGVFYPKNGKESFAFKTKNLFVFKRYKDNQLKIWKVIYNHSPTG